MHNKHYNNDMKKHLTSIILGITAMLSLLAPALAFGAIVFTDVDLTSWYGSSLERSVHLGLIEGYEDHTFRPEQPVTRAELVVILDRYNKYLADTYEMKTVNYTSGGISLEVPTIFSVEERDNGFTISGENVRIGVSDGFGPYGYSGVGISTVLYTDLSIAKGVITDTGNPSEVVFDDGSGDIVVYIKGNESEHTIFSHYSTALAREQLLRILETVEVG